MTSTAYLLSKLWMALSSRLFVPLLQIVASDGPSGDSNSESGNEQGPKLAEVVKSKPTEKEKVGKKNKKKKREKENGTVDKKNRAEKRKRTEPLVAKPTEDTAKDDAPKKKKRKRKLKADEIAEKPVEALTPDTLISALNKYYKDKLSTVEWDEIELDARAQFCECNDMTHSSVSYLKTIFPKWGKAVRTASGSGGGEKLKPGSPILLIITQAALRATQLNREIADFTGDDCKTAKLFAKHFKLDKQTQFLSTTQVHLGIGTPQRIQALLENGGLKLDSVRRVVLDWSWRDMKLRRLVEIPELKTPLFDLLKKFIIPRLKESSCKIGLM